MMFKGLKIVFGISLIVFILFVSNVIFFGKFLFIDNTPEVLLNSSNSNVVEEKINITDRVDVLNKTVENISVEESDVVATTRKTSAS